MLMVILKNGDASTLDVADAVKQAIPRALDRLPKEARGHLTAKVLFDQSVFAQLQALRGDTGGRSLLGELDLEFLDWPDTNLLLDIDTPEDYQRLQQME